MNKLGLLHSEYRSLLFLALITWFLAGCASSEAVGEQRPAARAEKVQAPASEVMPATIALLSPSPTVPPSPVTLTSITATTVPVAGKRVDQPATATAIPTVTLPPSPTPVPSPTTEPDRYCPEVAPLKPEYDRFFLATEKWPEPQPEIARTHFWMSKPLPGGGRVLINERFPYGWDENGRLLLHNGVDMAEELGTPVLAVGDGTVRVAQSDVNAWYGWRCDWYGHLVVLELDETWQDQPIYALYGHVLNLKVEAGQRVSRGDELAEVGFGGAATNPHLHFEVRVGENEFGATRNPMLWLDPGPTRGVVAGRLVDPQGHPWQGVPLAMVSLEDGQRYSTWSYLGDPQEIVNADEGWAENFVFSDVKPGEYDIYTSIQGVDYRQAVRVSAGEVSTIVIETEELIAPQDAPAETDASATTEEPAPAEPSPEPTATSEAAEQSEGD